jgi:hypothetical protein
MGLTFWFPWYGIDFLEQIVENNIKRAGKVTDEIKKKINIFTTIFMKGKIVISVAKFPINDDSSRNDNKRSSHFKS